MTVTRAARDTTANTESVAQSRAPCLCQLGNSMISKRQRTPTKTAPATTRALRSSQVANRKNPAKITAKPAPQGSLPRAISTALPNSPIASTAVRAVRVVTLLPFMTTSRNRWWSHDASRHFLAGRGVFPTPPGSSPGPLPGLFYSELMDRAQRQLSDQIDQATQRLLDAARVITEPDLRVPSLLEGWTRAYVLAHLARGA